jgi:type III restriction enzyme
MKLKFKHQAYQTNAVESVIDCFEGQPISSGIRYRIDPGKDQLNLEHSGFRNADIQLDQEQLLENIRKVQQRQNLPLSTTLISSVACGINLDVEMETGTGKTYCYIKTIFEMNKRYGWSKFIIVVPSIAIREGVYKSFGITADHFTESYSKKIRFFIYNSKQLHHLESFSSDAGINVMIINVQAFNSPSKDNRRIYDRLDDFQSRKPIDVIRSNRPILILDEPQKMEGKKTLNSLIEFNALMVLRYSATHRTTHNKIHRLDALDAYNQKLVKKIAVRGITVKGLPGTNAYLYLESIEISKSAPVARIEIEVKQVSGIKRVIKRLGKGDNLFTESGELDEYRGFIISQIDANDDSVEFTNGAILNSGIATGDITESRMRRIQIREAIKAHFEKEKQLFPQGIKVLSLFFIDEVAKYRDYNQPDEKGEYARIFEEEYDLLKKEYLNELFSEDYKNYLKSVDISRTHNGYFSIDKKTKRLKDPETNRSLESDDVDAYDLILKDKERLLSFEEPVRFIFSHSALREGWDNPNVFVMCMLKRSDNTISRRQEVGRGLRLSVNNLGERMDIPATVHDINVLTVVAGESYSDFVSNLQSEISESLSERPRKANIAYFTGKVISTEDGLQEITEDVANKIHRYLIKNDYIDEKDQIAQEYHDAKANGTLAALPTELAPLTDQIIGLIDTVYSEGQLPEIKDDRKPKMNPLNENFKKKEFQALWNRINRKAIYLVDFDSEELVNNCIKLLNRELRVSELQYSIQKGEQKEKADYEEVTGGKSFEIKDSDTLRYGGTIESKVRYDLLGKIAEKTQLTRKSIANILSGIEPAVFGQFKKNPEHFIARTTRLIQEQKASIIIEKLTYNALDDRHDIDIFTAGQTRQDFSRATGKLSRHIYDYAIVDSKVERDFVTELDTTSEVVVYAKLPRGFCIPTPVGDYNPDWAISFEEDSVKHIYFIAETKGTLSSLELRGTEDSRIKCARKFFDEINRKVEADKVKYDVVDSYDTLMKIVGVKAFA